MDSVKVQAIKYLGFSNQEIPKSYLLLLDEALKEIEIYGQFKAIYHRYHLDHEPLSVQKINLQLDYPALHDYLDNCDECILIGCTLGASVEKRIRYYSQCDLNKMMVLDALASAYLEEQCDLFEDNLLLGNRTIRFCPGYENTPLSLNKQIGQILNVEKHLGIQFTKGNLMIPQKSMIGIIGIGENKLIKHCHHCIKWNDCEFRKKGQHCYKND